MLTTASAAPTRRRRRATLAAILPTARVGHPGLVAATVGLASLPAFATLVFGGESYLAQLIVLGLAAGAALGWAADDPSAEVLAATPTSAPIRAAIRVAGAALLAGASASAVLVVVAVGPGLPADVGDRVPEAAAAAAAALACGFVAARLGERAAGAAAVLFGMTAPAFVAALSFKVHHFPTFMGGTHHDRWWLVGLSAACVALHAARDPARR